MGNQPQILFSAFSPIIAQFHCQTLHVLQLDLFSFGLEIDGFANPTECRMCLFFPSSKRVTLVTENGVEAIMCFDAL